MIILLILPLLLTSCSTMVSKDLMPYMSYREEPIIKIIEYSDKSKLQQDCYRIHKRRFAIYTGCTITPHDPLKVCTIRIMKGDDYTLEHELQHCHGYDDTYLPWRALR